MSYDAYEIGYQNGMSAGRLDHEAAMVNEILLPEHMNLTEEQAHDYSMGYNSGFVHGQREIEFNLQIADMEQSYLEDEYDDYD